MIQVNGHLLETTIKQRSGELTIIDSGAEIPAVQWILTRLAQLPLLADRLISTIPITNHYVTPEAEVLNSLENSPTEQPEHVSDALQTTLSVLDNRSPMETTVLYITSDAGEGKTSLINQLARRQAERYRERHTDWLLLPIPLGGRHFLHFDDITVGALQNKYRFPFLYYTSFLELVRLGVLIPAYDGFEEMLVENSSGEALSAMGILVNSLQSSGALVVAARKAYFDFQDLKSQARLRDLINTYFVSFGKLGLSRWGKSQFLAYCSNRGLLNPENLYDTTARRLGENHPLLTRPVLVRRLVDIAEESRSLDDFLLQLEKSGADYFSVFVGGIVRREACDVWIEKSVDGEVTKPLLSVEEHFELLSLVALEMWQGRVDYLQLEGLEFVTDYFCELKRKGASSALQIRERIKGHALLVSSSNAQHGVEFDHEEFNHFFLGEAIARLCFRPASSVRADLLNVLRKGSLPEHALNMAVQAIKRADAKQYRDVVSLIADVAIMDGQASFSHENCAAMVLALIGGVENLNVVLRRISFPANALLNRTIQSVVFEDCFFPQSSLERTSILESRFERCHFIRLDAYRSTVIRNVIFRASQVDMLSIVDRGTILFDPDSVNASLGRLGFTIPEVRVEAIPEVSQPVEKDEPVRQFERLMRCFIRSTHVSDNVMRLKLSPRGNAFVEEILPTLLKERILEEISNRRGGNQRHFKLGRAMALVNQALEECDGTFNDFIVRSRNLAGSVR